MELFHAIRQASVPTNQVATRTRTGSRSYFRRWSAALLGRRRYDPSAQTPLTRAYPTRQLWP